MLNSDALRPPQNSGRKALGKLATRLEEVKNPWRQGSTLELSHNEAARLATDALLESGEKEYKRVLSEERELNFLSPLEIRYITENVAKNSSSDSSSSNGNDFGEDTVSEMTSGTYFPMMSDEEPPMLELGWPENPPRYGPSETQIYFQRDKSHNVKDLIRSLISKAKTVIALVMDLFTDVDLLCDLMEAANKRRVPVYILLDEKSAGYFVEMCRNLDIQNSHLGHMRVRSVCGDTYCTKSGKKFTGQVKEKFLIIDCEEVIAGSYSFSWLSAQVHSNMVMHFSGRIVDSFDREFRCLYADSQIVDYFHNPDEEDLPTYPSYPSMVLPGLGHGLDLLPDRQRERVCSDNSSSQSSNSMSSVKAAPRMNTVYKVSQGHDRKESHNPHPNGRRGSGAEERERLREERERDRLTPTPQNPAPVGPRGASNGVTHHAPVPERPTPSYGQQAGAEWSKSNADDFHRPGLAGATSKFQAFGIYDHKPGPYPSPGPGPGPGPVSSSIPGPKPTSPVGDPGKPGSKNRAPSNPLLNKLTDLFLLPSSKDKEREPYVFKRSPPHSQSPAAWGGPDLSLSEPESKQNPPPPPTAGVLMNRHDQKRMTLGHSKLDLVNHYNKMKPKHAYSRFELKNNNFG